MNKKYALFKDGEQLINRSCDSWGEVFWMIAQPMYALGITVNNTLVLKPGYEIKEIEQ